MNVYLGMSLAGHDKNHIYVVYKEENSSFVLVNGTTKTVDNPKVKNKKHVQLIKHLPEKIKSKINNTDRLDDNVIKDIIVCYNNYLNSKQQ